MFLPKSHNFILSVFLFNLLPLFASGTGVTSVSEMYPLFIGNGAADSMTHIFVFPILQSDHLSAPTFVLDTQKKSGKDRKTFRWHRTIGYSVLAGSIASAILGTRILAKYQNNELPSDGALYSHRVLGITTGLLGVYNAYLGSINYKKLQGEKVGLKKRKTHRLLSSIASAGYLATTILGVRTYLEYRDAENPEDVEISKFHRGIALATTGFTLVTVTVIIW